MVLQIQAKSETVAAAWQLIEVQKADLASQQGKIAYQTNDLEQQTRQVLRYGHYGQHLSFHCDSPLLTCLISAAFVWTMLACLTSTVRSLPVKSSIACGGQLCLLCLSIAPC